MAECSRLCALVSRYLLPYIEPNPVNLTKESEKDLLLSLTSVFREIKKWVAEHGTEHGQEMVVTTDCIHSHRLKHHLEAHVCLDNAVSIMVALLCFDSIFVRHLSGNILVAFFDFLCKYESKWIMFLSLLWHSIAAAISSIYSCPLVSSEFPPAILRDENFWQKCLHIKKEISGIDYSIFGNKCFSLFRSRQVCENWIMLGVFFRILRNILKALKNDFDAHVEVYTRIAVASLVEVPWDSLSAMHLNLKFVGQKMSIMDQLPSLSGSKDVLLGFMVQLLCSLIGKNDSANDRLFEEPFLYSRFAGLIPKLLSFCFPKCLDYANSSLSHYLKHKVLMLMIRLSFHTHWQTIGLPFCVQLLSVHFSDLLRVPILSDDLVAGNALDESPFVFGTDRKELCNIYIRHMQRQVIYLLFKCWITSVKNCENNIQKHECPTFVLSSIFGIQGNSKEHCNIVSSLLLEWLGKFDVLDKSLDTEIYFRSCRRLALFFVQLYLEEDNMLFQMLLLLLDGLFLRIKEVSVEKVDNLIFHHISRIFNPIHLFHLFLFLIHYDHLVLLDYLISNDIGIHCVYYLLRCLRAICNTWITFLEFHLDCNVVAQTLGKKRKISTLDCHHKKGLPKRRTVSFIHEGSTLKAFENAKACLLLLKRSVEDLHKKNLFPYNPRPLLKSLSRFQDLCGL